MTTEIEKELTGAAGLAGVNLFLADSIALMLPWELTMCAAVVAEMLSRICLAISTKRPMRFGTELRRMMLKMLTYVPFVGMVSMVEIAAKSENHVAKWSCLVVAGIEIISIAANILRMMGYKVDELKLLLFILGKRGISGAEGVIQKDDNDGTDIR